MTTTLTLFRHADAEDLVPDAARPLSIKGKAQAKRAGLFCQQQHLFPQQLLVSPLLRCQQTAYYFNSAHTEGLSAQIDTVDWLAAGQSSGEDLCHHLQSYAYNDDLWLIGHEPDFSQLINRLLGTSQTAIKIKKSSLTRVSGHRLAPGAMQLQWSLPVQLMTATTSA